ncbi:MAG: hypothetical protein HC836_33170 [Richelia sp. RM2_1_2]|nr:hypothetical protein [Richelia sp. RM2_1_2]
MKNYNTYLSANNQHSHTLPGGISWHIKSLISALGEEQVIEILQDEILEQALRHENSGLNALYQEYKILVKLTADDNLLDTTTNDV